MRAGAAAEATLDEALAAEHDARAGQAQWPSIRDAGFAVKQNTSGNVVLLCDIAKAQARAGLTAKAVASFDEALRAAQAIVVPIRLWVARTRPSPTRSRALQTLSGKPG
jgi:hypothetical protein